MIFWNKLLIWNTINFAASLRQKILVSINVLPWIINLKIKQVQTTLWHANTMCCRYPSCPWNTSFSSRCPSVFSILINNGMALRLDYSCSNVWHATLSHCYLSCSWHFLSMTKDWFLTQLPYTAYQFPYYFFCAEMFWVLKFSG